MKQPYLNLGDAVWACLKPKEVFADMKNLYKIAVGGMIYTVIAYNDDDAKRTVIEYTNQAVVDKPFTLARIGVAGSDYECGVIGVEVDNYPDHTTRELLRLALLADKK
ncbi:hypothetical protein PHABIO_166 [Pseudomonas phage Phabio]|uniref:Uncharacterized protein n=1 Tax=Pseudomonas phage Phabio TaxID=2006668 RepID=A0A1Y0T1T7_9CAUD|nr:hypothetical protein MZD05_gp166 [Pseudomonas phage Phabio]ARV76797.1 hypothetical protein PHABIO_166 [Pseudomonas phage Phabio]